MEEFSSTIEKIKKETKPNVDIEKDVSILYDGRQFMIKIPNEISNFYQIKKGDKIKLIVKIQEPPKEHINTFKIIKKK